MLLEIVAKTGVALKKTAQTHGGEWTGPCPACGGKDRFHVWPQRRDRRHPERVGLYWCRGCSRTGDAVRFLVDFLGYGFREAAAELGVRLAPPREEELYPTPRPPSAAAPRASSAAAAPAPPDSPPEAWREKAEKIVEQASAALLSTERALERLRRRGIPKAAARQYRLGLIREDVFRPREAWGLAAERREDGKPKKLWIPAGLLIPLLRDGRVERLRVRRKDGPGPKYVVVPGSSSASFTAGDPLRPAAVVVESELDAIAVAAAASDLCFCVSTGSAQTMPDPGAAALLRAAKAVLLALDCDRAGAAAMRAYRERYPAAKPWPVPRGKDPGEAYALGVDLRAWVSAGLPAGLCPGPLPQKKEEAREGGGGAADEDLRALAELLARHPVEIRVAPDGSRVHIRENLAWKRLNWETSRRISELVFFGRGVLDRLLSCGLEIVRGGDLAALVAEAPGER